MRLAMFPIVSFFLAACARADYADPHPGTLIISAGPQPGYAIKQVVEKERPATLVADDGSVCRTSAERFNGTSQGKWIACAWDLPKPDSTAATPPS